jgi:hypothetical protein
MAEPWWLTRHLAEKAHSIAIEKYGGLPGIRGSSGLEASLATPKNLWAYGGEFERCCWPWRAA